MKRLFFLPVICLFPLFAYSQFNAPIFPKGFETLDTTAVRIFYDFNYPPTFKTAKRLPMVSVEDSLKVEKAADYMVLEIGTKGISKFYSDHKRWIDSLTTEILKNPQKVAFLQETIQNAGVQRADEREIFKNYPEGKMTTTDQAGMDAFIYEESPNEIQWQFTSDTMTCLNYLCQKATCDFRGRHYEAWFAPDLPINDGPWKFSGLPGLILYATDSGNQYIFKAIALDNAKMPLQFAKREYIKTSRKEIDKIKKRFADDPVGYMVGARGGQIPEVVPDGKGGTISREDLKMIYNPMELE